MRVVSLGRAIALSAAVLPLIPQASAAPAHRRYADLVLVGGKVFTADPAQPWAEAVAIRGDRVLTVGSSSAIRRLIGPGTRMVKLDGRVVVPGFNDAHQHVGAREAARQISLRDSGPLPNPAFAEVLDSIRALATRTPRGDWLRADIGESVLDAPDSPRDALDRIAPDHPVVLRASGTGHGEILNTAALRSLGIPEDVADPPGGWFARDGAGRLTGVVQEYADHNVSMRLISRRPDSIHTDAVRAASVAACALGITSIQDMAGSTAPAPTLRAVRDAHADVRLRIVRMPSTDTRDGVAEWRSAERAVPLVAAGTARVAGVKWILDGTPIERLAAMRSPYADRAGWYGHLNFTADTIRAFLRDALAQPPGAANQLMLHAVGDSTVSLVLHLMADLAPDSAWRARRLRIEHGDGLASDLIPLARRLGVIVVQNPAHFALPEGLSTSRLGSARASAFQPLRSLRNAGIPIAIGSDGPVNPFLNIMFATSHPNNPPEAITRQEAVIAYTTGSAYAEFAERDKGRLAPGMLADLAVLSQDIFTVPAQALPRTTSLLTLVGGRVVHSSGELMPATRHPGNAR